MANRSIDVCTVHPACHGEWTDCDGSIGYVIGRSPYGGHYNDRERA